MLSRIFIQNASSQGLVTRAVLRHWSSQTTTTPTPRTLPPTDATPSQPFQQAESLATHQNHNDKNNSTTTTTTTTTRCTTKPTTSATSYPKPPSPTKRRSYQQPQQQQQPHPKAQAPKQHPPQPSKQHAQPQQKQQKRRQGSPPRGGNERSVPQPQSPQPPSSFRDEWLPCGQHLDPHGTILPTSEWIHVGGTVPTCSLNAVVDAFEHLLQEEDKKQGIVDLEALWNPVQDDHVPTLLLPQRTSTTSTTSTTSSNNTPRFHANNDNHDDDDPAQESSSSSSSSSLVQAAHVILSPFGRPTGWHLKFSNRSLVNAILTRAQERNIRVAWKLVQVSEYQYHPPKNNHHQHHHHQDEDAAAATTTLHEKDHQEDTTTTSDTTDTTTTTTTTTHVSLVVDDSMVRFENCPLGLTDEYLRYLLSRYELAPEGKTVMEWKGRTNDGKYAPLMFVVRFASPAWARAAVRELQSMRIDNKCLKLIPYPNQIRYKNDDDQQQQQQQHLNERE